MKSVTILFGPNGAGKGTLTDGALVGREEEYNILATGNIIRNEVKQQTPLGQQAQTFMENGLLVPSDLILNMVLEAIKASEKPVILDGFPRNSVHLIVELFPQKSLWSISMTMRLSSVLPDGAFVRNVVKHILRRGPNGLRSMVHATSVVENFIGVKMTVPMLFEQGWRFTGMKPNPH